MNPTPQRRAMDSTVVHQSSPNNNYNNNHRNKCTTSDPIPTTSFEFLSSSPTDVVLSSSSSSSLLLLSASSSSLFQPRIIIPPPPQCWEEHSLHSSRPTGRRRAWPTFPMSHQAQRTMNPIRAILDPILDDIHQNHNCCDTTGSKMQISLALGDPVAVTQTTTSSASSASSASTLPLLPCPHAIRAVLSTLQSDHGTSAASYSNAIGTIEGRRAIATYHSHPPYYTYHPEDDIIIANGCSGALELLLTSLLDQPHPNGSPTSILLVPAPGFPLYRVIAESHGAMVVSYPLLPHQQWEVDLIQLQNIMEQYQPPYLETSRNDDGSTFIETTTTTTTPIRGIVINNPSNPTGAVYSTTHLQQIVHLCQQYCIPIIADEIYGDLIFPPSPPQPPPPRYDDPDETRTMIPATTEVLLLSPPTPPPPTLVSIAHIAAQMGRMVPVITASGIGKQFLLPGWRIGWICFQDNIYGSLQQVKAGAKRLAQIVLGASHLAQVAIPALLLTPPTEVNDAGDDTIFGNTDIGTVEYRSSYYELMEWKSSVRHTLYQQSKALCSALQHIGPCLQVIEPQGAMYAMVRINLEYFDHSVIRNDIDFTKLLYQEENVVVLPGTCFDFPNSFRVVFCAPIHILDEAARRIHQFCHRHLKQ